jgi:hypothetical protein
VEPLGGWKPSNLLPIGHHAGALPTQPQVLSLLKLSVPSTLAYGDPPAIVKEDATNMRAIAEKADRFLAIHMPQGRDTIVAALLVASESLRRAVWLPLQLAGASRSRVNL